MKKISTILFSVFLLLPISKCILPVTHAQSGTWLWGRCNTGADMEGYAVATDRFGNVYGAGYNFPTTYTNGAAAIFGSITVPNTATTGTAGGEGFIQALWVKYDSTGTALWADGTQHGDAWLYNITTDTSGDLIIFGSFDSPTIQIGGTTLTNAFGSSGGSQYFIAKYNPTGTLLWAISDGNIPNIISCLTFSDSYNGICIIGTGGITTDEAGNIYITSSFQKPNINIGSYTLTNADASGNTSDIFVAKYNPSGTLLWATRMGGGSDDCAYGITIGSQSNVYITGPFWSSSISLDSSVISNPYGIGGINYGVPLAYIAEFSPTGVPLWVQAAGGRNGAYGMGLASDALGNVYMTGGFGDVSVSFGSTTIARTYPASAPYLALYLVQYSPEHIVNWSKTIGSPVAGVRGFSIGLAACGEVWVSGSYYQDANVDGHILSYNWLNGSDPVFIAGYNLSGGVIGYSGLSSGGDDQNAIAVDHNGNVFICSDFRASSPPFTIGSDTLSGWDDEYFYIGKYANVVGSSGANYLKEDIPLCGASITLSAPIGFTGYYWEDATTLLTSSITLPGIYWVTCTNTGSCVPTIVDTFHVTLDTLPVPFSLGHDTTLCYGETYVLITGNSATLWNTGDTGARISVTQPGLYYASLTNLCGITSDSVRVGFNYCNIVIHDVITPNGDGINDTWVIEELSLYPDNKVQIFDKWGDMVYEKANYKNDWGGNGKSGALPDGTYYYLVKLNAQNIKGGQNTWTGTVLIKR